MLVALLVVVVVVETARGDIRPPPRTARAALRAAPEAVEVRPAPAFRALADALTHAAGLSTSGGSLTSVVAAGTIDATADALGPLFLPRAGTLGTAGAVNVNATAQHYTLDEYGGARPLGATAPPMVATRAPTGELVGLRMRYALAYHIDALAVAATVALRADLDASVVLPIVAVDLDLQVDARVVRAARGDRFVRLRGTPTRVRDVSPPLSSAGVGDLTARLKWALPLRSGLGETSALTLQGTFPTGDAAQAHGGGTYLVNVGGATSVPWALAGVPGQLVATAAVSFDLRDATQTRLLYGLGAAAALLRRPALVGVVEFLGQSQLDATPTRDDLGVVVLTSATQLGVGPVLGLAVGRLDTFDLAFGVRLVLAPRLVVFASATVPLNDAGLRASRPTPTLGIGGSF